MIGKSNGGGNSTGPAESPNHFRFNLTGLIAFSLCLILGTFLAGNRMFSEPREDTLFFSDGNPDQRGSNKSIRSGAWGDLLTQSIKLERPVEYVAGEVQNIQPLQWKFSGLNAEQVRNQIIQGGLNDEQADALMAAGQVITKGNATVVSPPGDFILSLSPETRQKLYTSFHGRDVYELVDFPYVFPRDGIESVYGDKQLNPDDVAVLKKLIFHSGSSAQLVDFPVLMLNIPTFERRVAMARSLSRQSAVLARLYIRPDSDIDKIASYWGSVDNVRFTNVRPMIEALKRSPGGGSISLAYLLPPFARERLYTYPLPPEGGEPDRDCHWSTFNFSNTEPDNRFNDVDYTVRHIDSQYYRIDQPNLYGDIVLLVNDRQEAKHSAVFIADDLVFTKYGNNYTQPWMLVRLSDMQEHYPNLSLWYMRKKTK